MPQLRKSATKNHDSTTNLGGTRWQPSGARQMANGSMPSNQSGNCPARSATKTPKANQQRLPKQRDIRRALIKADRVDTTMRESALRQSEATPQILSAAKNKMLALPGQLFYSTQIPVCLWFISCDKSGGQPSTRPAGHPSPSGRIDRDERNPPLPPKSPRTAMCSRLGTMSVPRDSKTMADLLRKRCRASWQSGLGMSLNRTNLKHPSTTTSKVSARHSEFSQKETPGPLNRKRSRKGSRGQHMQIALFGRAGQTLFRAEHQRLGS
jgi:hypothetical protein